MEKLQEMENKVETLEVEIEEERIRLMNLNDQITSRMLKIETSGLSTEERMEKEQIKKEEEKIRDKRIEEVSKKKDRVKALYLKKRELLQEKNLIDEYLNKYYQVMRDLEGVIKEDMGEKRKREEDNEQTENKRAKTVSIFVKPYQTFSKHNFNIRYATLIIILVLFLQVPEDSQSEQSKEKDSEEQKQKEQVSIFLKPSQTLSNPLEQY